MTRWTAAEKDLLREKWLAGSEPRAIAEVLGRTRDSVIGQAHRLNLPTRRGPQARSSARDQIASNAPDDFPERCYRLSKRYFSTYEIARLYRVTEPEVLAALKQVRGW